MSDFFIGSKFVRFSYGIWIAIIGSAVVIHTMPNDYKWLTFGLCLMYIAKFIR